MYIKITKIISVKEPFQPVGKSYKMYSWIVAGEIDGRTETKNMELKAFKPEAVYEGSECEVEMQDYLGNISYKIIRVKKTQPALQSTTSGVATNNQKSYNQKFQNYTLEEYDDLFAYAWNLFEPRLVKITDHYQRYECLQKLISTFIISAVQIGIKAPVINDPYSNNQQYHNKQKLLVG